MIEGKFIGDYPFIKIIIASSDAIQERYFIIDTGFSGYLQVSSMVAKELNLKQKGVITVRLANGEKADMAMSTIKASIGGKQGLVDVLISDTQPLLGIKFLKTFGCRLILDCKKQKIFLYNWR